jgi:hypothetical protein
MTERYTMRWKPSDMHALEQICARHGTNVADFLRACGQAVIAQYGATDGRDASTAA